MKKFTKIVSVVLAAAMVFSMTACGSTGGSKRDDNTVSIYRASFNLGNPDTAEVDAIAAEINKYLESKGSKVKVQIKDIPSGEFPEKANLALTNGEIDLLWTAAWQSVIDCKSLYNNNAVYDITDLLPGTTLYGSMPQALWDGSKYGGKNLFVPVYKDSVEGYDVMFRQDLIDKYGWDISKVKTLKDLETTGILEDAKKEGLPYPYLSQHTAMFYRYYIDKFDCFTQNSLLGVDRATNSVVNPIATPEYKEFVTLMCHWADLGYLSEDEATKTTTDQTTQTQDWAVSWWTDIPNNDEADGRYNQNVSFAPITGHWAHTNSTLGSCYAISSKCSKAKAQACIEFLGYLFTDNTVASLYTYGIEGKDYDLDANGQVVKKGDMYNHSMWESTSALALDTLEAGEPVNKKSLYEAFNGSATGSSAAGFMFDDSKVNDKLTACNDVLEQYGFVLENGGFAEKDVDAKLAEFQAALDAAGYQDVLAEAQKQYDEWKK